MVLLSVLPPALSVPGQAVRPVLLLVLLLPLPPPQEVSWPKNNLGFLSLSLSGVWPASFLLVSRTMLGVEEEY